MIQDFGRSRLQIRSKCFLQPNQSDDNDTSQLADNNERAYKIYLDITDKQQST
jgi:hypothetical protein